ncbi:uncharacterized protein LOC101862243 [Aplysia californica]|uniref:Uncharacterized protein LOC101862243 n=1 Tax=Aplysia californica TaxID=6500 RepID=A0ABM1ABF9_APLCA|nr:uncharacterized protein LOC101862243 [Aplysia californica]
MLRLAVLVCALCSSHALLFSTSGGLWNNLKVTWGLNPFSSSTFVGMPRTETQAISQGFKKISSCSTTGTFRGNRYVKGNDYAVVLLYDVKGYIAGIQASIPGNQTDGFPKHRSDKIFVKDGDRYTITAYFVDPSTICTTGRSAAQFSSHGTGTNLYIQKDENPEASTMIPHQETNVKKVSEWTEGKCFLTMGKHYWHSLTKDKNMDCNKMLPVFLLYNGGELNGFGWAMNTNLGSPRYEHPTKTSIPSFMHTVPTCLLNAQHLSTMHIYFTTHVELDLC